MKIVDITDIEDLILCKHEIDCTLIEHGDLEQKMQLQEFMSKYVNLNTSAYINKGEVIGFSYIDIYGKQFLLVQERNEEQIETISNVLKKISYDFSNLKKVSNTDLISSIDEKPFILYENTYYSF